MMHITRQEALTRLLRGVADDVKAYDDLLLLLEQQFDAIVRHQSARLTELAACITQETDAMELRRRQRVALVKGLLGPTGAMPHIVAMLKGMSRQTLESNWKNLEQMELECKRCNTRNSTLLTDQYSIMQRVLHGDEQIYAPA